AGGADGGADGGAATSRSSGTVGAVSAAFETGAGAAVGGAAMASRSRSSVPAPEVGGAGVVVTPRSRPATGAAVGAAGGSLAVRDVVSSPSRLKLFMGASGADIAEAPDTGDSRSSACTGAGWVGPA